jgi:aminoglycoside 6'-N-acetyltransferase I
MDIRVRPATGYDIEGWLRMRKALWPYIPEDKHRQEMEQSFSSPGVVFVAEHKEAGLVGFAEISIRKDYVPGASGGPVPYVEGWYVDETYQGSGIGRSLIEAAERWSLEKGFTRIASDALIDNSKSIAVHTALGFREVERCVHFIKSLDKAS